MHQQYKLLSTIIYHTRENTIALVVISTVRYMGLKAKCISNNYIIVQNACTYFLLIFVRLKPHILTARLCGSWEFMGHMHLWVVYWYGCCGTRSANPWPDGWPKTKQMTSIFTHCYDNKTMLYVCASFSGVLWLNLVPYAISGTPILVWLVL